MVAPSTASQRTSRSIRSTPPAAEKGADSSTYTAPALEKGLEILELLSQADAPMTLMQLSQSLNRSSSEIYRMVEVLVQRGYLVREAGQHRLSLKLFNLGVGQIPSRGNLPHTQVEEFEGQPMLARFSYQIPSLHQHFYHAINLTGGPIQGL